MKRFLLFKRFNRRRLTKKFPVPVLTTPYTYEMNRTRRKFLVLFIVLSIVTLFYGYFWQEQRKQAFDLIPVLVAAQDVLAPEEIIPSHIRIKYYPRQDVPVVVFNKDDNVLGQTLIRDLVRNQILLPHHFQSNIDPESISTKFTKFFAFSLNEDWFEGKLPNLVAHDRIDILAVNPKTYEIGGQILAQNLEVIEVITYKKNNAKTLVVNTTNDEAQALLFARGNRLPMQVLVRSSVSTNTPN